MYGVILTSVMINSSTIAVDLCSFSVLMVTEVSVITGFGWLLMLTTLSHTHVLCSLKCAFGFHIHTGQICFQYNTESGFVINSL